MFTAQQERAAVCCHRWVTLAIQNYFYDSCYYYYYSLEVILSCFLEPHNMWAFMRPDQPTDSGMWHALDVLVGGIIWYEGWRTA